MSYHRENIIWQSADGTWSRGFYETYDTGSWDDDEYDSEWDVDYRFDAFEWVSTGHATEQAASAAWDGANPGGHSVLAWGERQAENEKLDDMAAKMWANHAGSSTGAPHWARRDNCSGTPKQRVPRYLAKDIADATAEAAHYKLGGYANMPKDVSADTAQLRARFPGLTDRERAEVVAELNDGIARIRREMVSDGGQWVRRIPPTGSKEFAEKQLTALSALATDAEPPKALPAASARAKTTAKSTPGSFAPKGHSAPDVTLG